MHLEGSSLRWSQVCAGRSADLVWFAKSKEKVVATGVLDGESAWERNLLKAWSFATHAALALLLIALVQSQQFYE